ncbi:hypothetical protein [Halorhabdus sp. BNX81]|uniref:DUF7521 family protein n=1 Tax=Halorhabdus sp. BNX81 TaxID=2980181 RepID=UPI0023DD3DA5|nr:hypothetical protein [Halorhabdus sp. BNX81]
MTVIPTYPPRQTGEVPLQSATTPSGLVELLLLAASVTTVVIGIAIAYVAFRGYRRNKSRQMLFLAIGFVLVIAFPGTAEILLYVLTVVLEFQLPINKLYLAGIMQASQLLGMASILYALVKR